MTMQEDEVRLLIMVASLAVTLVLVAAILTLRGVYQSRKMKVARDQILNYLKSNNFTMISLSRIRDNINPAYSDQFLEGLPDYFPNDLRRARLKDKDGNLNRHGLARIRNQLTVEEGTAGERSAG
jgi:hypothetical protein